MVTNVDPSLGSLRSTGADYTPKISVLGDVYKMPLVQSDIHGILSQFYKSLPNDEYSRSMCTR